MTSRSEFVLVALSLAALGCSATPAPAADGIEPDGGASETTVWNVDDSDSETETAATADATDDADPGCDYPALDECLDPIQPAYQACSAPCPESVFECGDADCIAGCELARRQAEVACLLAHCSNPPRDAEDACLLECWTDFSTCIAGPDCDIHSCQWDTRPCITSCVGCFHVVQLDFAFADSCEFALPDGFDQMYLPWIWLELAGQEFGVGSRGSACDDPPVGATVSGEHAITLCPMACTDFMELGSLRLVIGGPSCP